MVAFLGLRGTGDWATDQRPKHWRDMILRLYPNGTAPLTALTARMASESVDDPEFIWWTKTLSDQSVSVTGVYTNANLSSAYASGGTAGQVLYIKMAEADADEFRVGHQVLLRDASHYDVDVNAEVTAVMKNGDSSYLAVKLLEADDNGASTDLSDCDTALIVGNINSEGAAMPDAVSYDPVKHYNYTQIFRNPLEITRTAKKTKLRTGDAYQELKRETLEYHSVEMEKAFLWGIRTEGTGTNGKPKRTTQGLIPTIKTDASANCNDFSLNSSFSGKTWLQGGEEWLDYYMEQIYRYGATEKLAFAGSGALLGIAKLVKSLGWSSFGPETTSYGIKVNRWVTPFGELMIKTHPLFSLEATNRYSMVIFEPKNIKYRYITDTVFYSESEKQNTGRLRYDETKEEYLTECGLEFHHPIGWGYLNGVGVDNIV